MTSFPVTKSGYGSLQNAGTTPCSGVQDTYLVFLLCAGFLCIISFNLPNNPVKGLLYHSDIAQEETEIQLS